MNTIRKSIINSLKNNEHKTNERRAKCSRCGNIFEKGTMVGTQVNTRSDGKYLYTCLSCMPNTYYHGNELIEIGKPNKDLLKCGIELELNYIDENVRNWFYQKQWDSTNDSSLHDEEYRGKTCEMVSPLHNGFKSFTKQIGVIDEYLKNGLLEINESCGTHFHVSVQNMTHNNENIMYRLRNNRKNIFGKMEKMMIDNPRKTVEFFGRNFTDYADTFANRDKSSRYAWVNLTRNTDIEFRLNKFVSGEQFHKLCMFEIELCKYIVYNINEPNVKYSEMSEHIAEMLEKAWA